LIFTTFYYSGIGGGLELFLLLKRVLDPLSLALSRRERGMLFLQNGMYAPSPSGTPAGMQALERQQQAL
jgi:hypothetical protein